MSEVLNKCCWTKNWEKIFVFTSKSTYLEDANEPWKGSPLRLMASKLIH